MSLDRDDLGKSARTVADAGGFVERAAHLAKPSTSTMGRIGAAISVAKLGRRVLPAGWRLAKRYPVASALAVAGILLAVYLTRPARTPPRF